MPAIRLFFLLASVLFSFSSCIFSIQEFYMMRGLNLSKCLLLSLAAFSISGKYNESKRETFGGRISILHFQ